MSTKSILVTLTLMLSACWAMAQQPSLQYFRPWDKEGINVFEPTKKTDQPEFTGFKLRIGGAFTQDFQSLRHTNRAAYSAVSSTNSSNKNLLYGTIKTEDSTAARLTGFNLAMANLNFDFQIADGIRVSLENYMSSRHHSEFWVKGGYIMIDKLPMFGEQKWFDDYFRVKIGHFQPNFGDAQFRRSDGGNTIFNPFVENYILDAFTTEIGGEVYVFPAEGFMGMIGMTSGFINGNIENYSENNNNFGVVPTKKSPSITAKIAYDKTYEDLRVRLSASFYNNPNAARNTLYAGDRTGSHYFMVMEPAVQPNTGTASTAAAQFTSGRFNPNVANRVQAFMINPFIKYKGLEVFGSYEILLGSVYGDTLKTGGVASWEKRSFNQMAIDAVYRFLKNEQAYVGVRYVKLKGQPDGNTFKEANGTRKEVDITRMAVSAGWFPTKNLLLKGEWVAQTYGGFPTGDYRNDTEPTSLNLLFDQNRPVGFGGFVVSAVVGF